MAPKVSTIIPYYNKAQYLPEAIDSVHSQTFQDWKCIILNDGVHDNTEEIALDYCSLYKRFIYFYQENQGSSLQETMILKQVVGFISCLFIIVSCDAIL